MVCLDMECHHPTREQSEPRAIRIGRGSKLRSNKGSQRRT
jgi:hypothetical protein